MVNTTQKEINDRLEQTPENRRSDELTAKERINLCNSCEHKTSRLGFDACNECGCFIYLKAHIKYSRCPINKWEIEEL